MLGELLFEDQQKNLWSRRLHQGDVAVETAGPSAGPPQAAVDAKCDAQYVQVDTLHRGSSVILH